MAVTTITSLKVGVGCTTTAIHLAQGAALAGLKVLLVDFTADGAASDFFGELRQGAASSTLSLLEAGGDLRLVRGDAIVSGIRPNLDLLPTHADIEHLLGEYPENEMILVGAIAQLGSAYELVVIDGGSSLNILSRNALAASALVITPITPEPTSAYFLRDIWAEAVKLEAYPKWFALRSQTSPGEFEELRMTHRLALVVEDQQYQSWKNSQAFEDTPQLSIDLLRTIIGSDFELSGLLQRRMTAFDTNEENALAQSYMQLVEEINDISLGFGQRFGFSRVISESPAAPGEDDQALGLGPRRAAQGKRRLF